MKISDFIHQYPGSCGMRRIGICRVRIFTNTERKIFLVLTDIGRKNTSSSVTNSVEVICQSLIDRGHAPSNGIFIEHYEPNTFHDNTFDLVTLNSSGYPNWEKIGLSELEEMLESTPGEFNLKTLDQPHLLSDIDRIRNEIDPFIDSPYPEDYKITKRRNDIDLKKISKKSIIELIEKQPKEQDIQRLLKQDLSLFAEIYADPKEEYICFSEFPISGGSVDFAIFSGRSRMDVTLIEVKGAEFHLVNQGSYNKFNSKIEDAADQLRNRLRYVIDEIKDFRSEVHKIRINVEKGQKEHNSLLGPMGRLEVDPNKDINIRCVIIGGRTRDDQEESRKRHDFERLSSPSIRVESWDTWIRKIRRE